MSEEIVFLLSDEYMIQLENQPSNEIVLSDDLPLYFYSDEELLVMNEETVKVNADGRWVFVYSAAIEKLVVEAGSINNG